MFRFKQFGLHDHKSSMKVNTDAILLGAWADIDGAENILEVGTGCGLVSLMLAQKNPTAKITAIDIDANSVQQANENFLTSPWKNRLSALEISFQDFVSGNPLKYDVIISNPPYFENGLLPEENAKLHAKHTQTLHFNHILSKSKQLLTHTGKLIFIVPYTEKNKLLENAVSNGFFPSKHLKISPTPEKSPFRSLIEIRVENSTFDESSFSIQTSNHFFSEFYKSLTRDFHPEHFLNKRV